MILRTNLSAKHSWLRGIMRGIEKTANKKGLKLMPKSLLLLW
jgi:hypothetical protein